MVTKWAWMEDTNGKRLGEVNPIRPTTSRTPCTSRGSEGGIGVSRFDANDLVLIGHINNTHLLALVDGELDPSRAGTMFDRTLGGRPVYRQPRPGHSPTGRQYAYRRSS